ncbi:hypothetical protein OIU85_005487 [Salix viminalis]|uniref:PB1 domain-containing protein n=1 Tax=Salix viminalis TaxID=40686 RepID=A0A6N2L9L4_SALVM|nr:hypothetical protein OIU85_005487 [Salix viminalis]
MVGPSLDTAKIHLKAPAPATSTIKFLCSYGGKIIPRFPDGKLRYQGGETRVIGVDRSISFSELLLKLGELCGTSVSLRCQLPKEDLDALISITSDEDLANLIEEYDRAGAATPAASLKIRAFLSLPKKIYSSSSSSSSSNSPSNSYGGATITSASTTPRCYHHQISKPVAFSSKKMTQSQYQYGYHGYGNPTCTYLVQNGNHWL